MELLRKLPIVIGGGGGGGGDSRYACAQGLKSNYTQTLK